jgi:hypothetical protein
MRSPAAMSPRARASSAAPICPRAIPPKSVPRSSIASTRASSAELEHVVGRSQPLHHRQGGAGVLGGGRGVAQVHRQVGEPGVEQRRGPRPVVGVD